MELRDSHRDGALVVAPTGRIDSNTSDDLERHLLGVLDAGETCVVVDLDGVEYISSAGLRVLLHLAKRLRQAQGRLAVCAMQEAVRQVFELAGFMAIFTVTPGRDAAVAEVTRD